MRKKLTEEEVNPFDGKPKTAEAHIRRTAFDGKELPVFELKAETMRIKLNIDYTVCLDGIHPSSFAAGSEVEMPLHIAQSLLEDGRACVPGGVKCIPSSPENKMLPGSESNKALGRKR